MPIAAIEQRDVLAIGVFAVLLLFAGFMIVTATAERRRRARIPWSMRPGPPDNELERRIIARYYAWGGIATLFMAIFLPAYLMHEPSRIKLEEKRFLDRSIGRGADIFGEGALTSVNCARCHGAAGRGGVQPVRIVSGKDVTTTTMPEPPLAYIVARYKAAGRNEEDIRQLTRDAIERGRPGTPMPTWGLSFGGPLNAQQVDDVINFILAPAPGSGLCTGKEPGDGGCGLQEDAPTPETLDGGALFAQNCAICHGPRGDGLDADGNRSVGPNLTIELQRNTPDQITDTIVHGRLNTNRVSMPAWAFLGTDAIKALVRFIESIQRG